MALSIVGARWSGLSVSASKSRLVTVRSVMPQGTMRSKSRRSVVTLRAKPWEVMPRDGGDFLFRDGAAGDGPDAGASGDALRGDTEVGAGADEGFFEEADVLDGSEARVEAAQIEDGVADELSGSVVGDVASAIDLVDLDAAAGQQFV
jgi:hypothetical protein